MQGFAYVKLHGYAGDFEIIEKIYGKNVSLIEEIHRWDLFFHSGAAPNAVRNRSKFLEDFVKDRTVNFLISIGCGSGCDIRSVAKTGSIAKLTMVDSDKNAIRRAKARIGEGNGNGNVYINRNVFRTHISESFDIV